MTPPEPQRLPQRHISTVKHAWCTRCDWTSTDENAKTRAIDHNIRTRHGVRVAQTTVIEYLSGATAPDDTAPPKPPGGRDPSPPPDGPFHA